MRNLFKNKKNYSRTQGGFLAVEILVAASIIVISVLAFMNVAQKFISVSSQTFHTGQASFLLEEGAEAVRVVRDNNWSNITNLNPGTNYYPTLNGGTWILSTTGNTVGIFTRTVVVVNVLRDNTTKDISAVSGTNDPNTKLFTVTVSWMESGNTITKTLSFYLTNLFS